MKIITSIILALITLITSFFGSAPKTELPANDDPSIEAVLPSYQCESTALELFEMVNDYRAENGLNKLILNSDLCRLAYVRAHEQELAKGHTRPDGSRFVTVFNEYGIIYKTAGENIAISSYDDAKRMFEGWKNSQTHNDNMLDQRWHSAGMAVYLTDEGRYCFVNLFATEY